MNKIQLTSYKEQFLNEEKLNEKSEKTLIHYDHVVSMFIDSLNDDDMTKNDVIDFKRKLMEIYKPSTINNYIVVVNKFIKYCEVVEKYGEFDYEIFRKHYSKMVMKNVRVQQKSSLEDILEPAEYKRMLRMAKKKGFIDMYLIMKILGYTGIRISELKYFTVKNIQTNYIEVNNKGKIRKIILRNDLKNELISYCKENEIKEGIIFKGNKKNEMISQSAIWKSLRKIGGMCRGIKISKIHAHSFRHLFAIRFMEQGGDIGELADILGHSSIDTTRIYIRTTDNMKRKKLEKMKY